MRHRLTGTTARTLGGGNTLAPGELVTLTSEQADHPDTAWLLTEGLLVEDADEADETDVEELAPPAPKRQGKAAAKAAGKAGEGDDATAETDQQANPADDDTNGGSDR